MPLREFPVRLASLLYYLAIMRFFMSQTPKKPVRCYAFIDGFNVYVPLHKHYQRTKENLKWLDYAGLIRRLMKTNHFLQQFDCVSLSIDLFTAVPHWQGDDKILRHETFIKANEANNINIFRGRFTDKQGGKHEEKESDVALAIQLYRKASLKAYDLGFIFSADTDFVPAIQAVQEDFSHIQLVGIMPPSSQKNSKLLSVLGQTRRIKEAQNIIHTDYGLYRSCQLPNEVIAKNGTLIHNPYT
jgi:uncharacterized LabA/DUF88 family protein